MRLLAELAAELWQRPWRSSLVWPLIIINLAGSGYGYYWYRLQLAETPVLLWPVVPDSPLATTFFALALLAVVMGLRPGLLTALACVTCIKYGLWAVGVITHSWVSGVPFTLIEGMLWVSHLGMALQGFIFLRVCPLPAGAVLGAGLWMTFNDYMDYGRGYHPYLYMAGQEAFAALLAVGLTALGAALLIRTWVCNHSPVN